MNQQQSLNGKFLNPMKPEDRGCLCKRRFATKEECEESIRRQNSKIPLRAYKCSFCRQWHKTKHKAPATPVIES